MFGGILLNHTHSGPLRVVGKALHIISSGTLWRCIVVLKVVIWSHKSRVPSYEFREGILNLEGRGWLLMEAIKGESVQWINLSTGFILLNFFPYLIHGLPHLIHLPLQVWHSSWSGTPWLVLMLSVFSFSNFLTMGLSFDISLIALSP